MNVNIWGGNVLYDTRWLNCAFLICTVIAIFVEQAYLPGARAYADSLRFKSSIQHPFLEDAMDTGSLFGTTARIFRNSLFVVDHQDDQAGSNLGAVYRFSLEGEHLASYFNPDLSDDTLSFGLETFVDQNTVYIGARRNSVDGRSSGVVHKFNLDGAFINSIYNPGVEPEGDVFGTRILRVQDSLWISAPSEDTVRDHAGAIHVFDLEGEFQRTILPPQHIIGTAFGSKFWTLPSGNVLVAMSRDDSDANNAGSVLVLDTDGKVLGRIADPDPVVNGRFGEIGMSSDPKETILVGRLQNSSHEEWSEKSYVFNLDHDHLLTLEDPNPAFENWFGRRSDTIDDEFYLVGSLFDDALGENAGAVHLYNHRGEFVESIYAPNPSELGGFGSTINVVDDQVFIGEVAFKNERAEFTTGAIHIFEFNFPAGDADWDGVVGLQDFATLKENFGKGTHFYEGDFDRDDDVDLDDFAILKESFGNRYNDDESPVVPEPHGLWLALSGLALAGWMGRRRRRPGRLDSGQ